MSRSRRSVESIIGILAPALIAACAHSIHPLTGAPVPAVLPRAAVPLGHHRLLFNWELQDGDMTARGEGIARVAYPDSARLDVFLAGGFGSGTAILIDDSLQVAGSNLMRRFIPPTPLLWATLGRASLPPARDTTARVDGELLRVDIGRPVNWRVTFRRDTLFRMERVRDGRVLEWVERSGSAVRYRSEEGRRSLSLIITRAEEVPAFDASIWGLF
jgi:hypothetical protein